MEDVSFMFENGETETHVIFVDSSARDTVAFPDPASYVIPFDSPLKNVVGVDVLDSVIPATMYVIDTHNYDLRLYAVATDSTVHSAALVDRVPSYFKWWMQLEDDPGFDPYSTDTTTATNVARMDILDARLGAAIVDPLVDSPAAKGRVLAVRAVAQYAANSGQPPDGCTVATYNSVTYWLPGAFGYGVLRCVLGDEGGEVVLATLVHATPSAAAVSVACHRLQFPSGNFGTYATFLSAGATGGGGAVAATVDTTPTGSAYLTSVSSDPDRLQMVQISSAVWAAYLGGDACFVAFDMGCGMAKVLGFLGSLGDSNITSLSRSSLPAKQYFVNQVDEGPPGQFLQPNGLINLTSERYIILRCIEVEAGMFDQAVTGGQGIGVGLFKLPVPGSFREQRQEYTSVNRRPYHPIGRMDQLTIRLERGTLPGTLYNFKGIDHLMLVAIKVLVPKKLGGIQRSVLNPNYDPDFLRYNLRYRLRDRGLPGGREPVSERDVSNAMRRHEFLLSREDGLDRVWPPAEVDQRSESETESD